MNNGNTGYNVGPQPFEGVPNAFEQGFGTPENQNASQEQIYVDPQALGNIAGQAANFGEPIVQPEVQSAGLGDIVDEQNSANFGVENKVYNVDITKEMPSDVVNRVEEISKVRDLFKRASELDKLKSEIGRGIK